MLRLRHDHRLRVQLAWRSPTNEHRLQPVVARQHIHHLGPSLGQPVLLRFAGRDDDGRDRPLDWRVEAALPVTLRWPRPEVPRYRLVRDAECGEELEVLILDVLAVWVRGDLSVREEPVEVARTRAIEAKLHRRARKRRDEPGLEIHLQVDHDVELPTRELATDVEKSLQALTSVEQHDVINARMPTHERRGSWLEYPGDVRARLLSLDRVDDGEDVHRVAHGAHHHDADPVHLRRNRSDGAHPLCPAIAAR